MNHKISGGGQKAVHGLRGMLLALGKVLAKSVFLSSPKHAGPHHEPPANVYDKAK